MQSYIVEFVSLRYGKGVSLIDATDEVNARLKFIRSLDHGDNQLIDQCSIVVKGVGCKHDIVKSLGVEEGAVLLIVRKWVSCGNLRELG